MTELAETAGWERNLARLADRIAPRFSRVEPRRRALSYLRGLLGPAERKNGWQLAEAVGDATPDGMQDFLSRMRWDAGAVRDDLRAYVVEHLGEPDGVLVLDETGFVKKGDKSAGVQRQYSGTAGRIETCQIGVFLGYASHRGRALIDRALYLPQSWSGDPARCAAAGIPKEVGFATKPQLALTMLKRALDAGVPCAWVAADSVYGCDHRIRQAIAARGIGYVLTVTSGQRLGQVPVEEWLAKVRPGGWQRLSAGAGAKGPRLYDWAFIPYQGAARGWQKGLLIRRRIAKPDEITFYLTHAPKRTSLADLVQVAGTRWTIESCFEEAKGEVGLDDYEVRSWTGWHRHITLAMLAYVYLATLRQQAVAIGGQGHARPRRRPAAPHRPRGAPPALAPALAKAAQPRQRPPMVRMAPTTPTTRQAIPLEKPHNPHNPT